jgi:MFS family permease
MNFAQTRRVIFAGMIGNVLEWYDFAIYGYFATAIGHVFFPYQDRVAQLLSAFGVFALGYLMRPLGGAITGHIGDRFGRRAATGMGAWTRTSVCASPMCRRGLTTPTPMLKAGPVPFTISRSSQARSSISRSGT